MYLVGKIVGTHGIKGELKVKSDTSFDRFKKGNVLYIEKEEKIVINSSRVHKGMHLITINGLTNINDVLCYVNKDIYVPHDRSELEEGEFYYEDIIGLDCYNSKGELIGPVKDLQEVPQGLILEIQTKNKTILIPFVDEFVVEVDLENKRIQIQEIEGLL
jgi:16S rRNA processing protein RimM